MILYFLPTCAVVTLLQFIPLFGILFAYFILAIISLILVEELQVVFGYGKTTVYKTIPE